VGDWSAVWTIGGRGDWFRFLDLSILLCGFARSFFAEDLGGRCRANRRGCDNFLCGDDFANHVRLRNGLFGTFLLRELAAARGRNTQIPHGRNWDRLEIGAEDWSRSPGIGCV